MDIKPDNIFVSLPEQSLTISCVIQEEEEGEGGGERGGVENTQLLYKIGKKNYRKTQMFCCHKIDANHSIMFLGKNCCKTLMCCAFHI